jgi:AcrR family transcriptional regulator
METKTEAKEGIKSQILCKSENRFSHYGFNKTTMAEIAKDCDMSAANLYRYFENKEEIAVHIVEQCMQEKEKIFRSVVQMSGLSTAEMLEKIVLEELNYLCCQVSEKTKISELVQYISTHRIDILDAHCGRKKALIAEIMAKGNASGEFQITDIVAAAETFITATVRFWMLPLFFMLNEPVEKVKEQAKNVVSQLVNGLSKQ